jgi:hypothetical protein
MLLVTVKWALCLLQYTMKIMLKTFHIWNIEYHTVY